MEINILYKNILVYYSDIGSNDADKNYLENFNNLPNWRKKKAENFIFDKDKMLSVYVWALLDWAFKDLGFNIDDFTLDFSEYEKPFFVDCPLHYNLSHSGSFVMCAISNVNVGCDVEKIGDYDNNLAKSCMQQDEVNHFLSIVNNRNSSIEFYRYWTLKESIMKCCGLGVNLDPKNIKIQKTGNEYSYIIDDAQIKKSVGNYNLYNLDISDDYCFSVCDSGVNKKIISKSIEF